MLNLTETRITFIVEDYIVRPKKFFLVRELVVHTSKNQFSRSMITVHGTTHPFLFVEIDLNNFIHKYIETRLVKDGALQQKNVVRSIGFTPTMEILSHTGMDNSVELLQLFGIRKDYLRQSLTTKRSVLIEHMRAKLPCNILKKLRISIVTLRHLISHKTRNSQRSKDIQDCCLATSDSASKSDCLHCFGAIFLMLRIQLQLARLA